jgi:hypothetical protein
MAADIGNMEPRGPLKEEIGEDQHPYFDIDDLLDFPDSIREWFVGHENMWLPGLGWPINLFGNVVGDDIAVPEHPLQIRIGDVPLDEIEIRNVYSASVKYTGIHPSQQFATCNAEAKAIIDAQGAIVNLEKEAANLSTEMKEGGPRYPALKSKYDNIQRKLANTKAYLRAAEFIYGRCKEREIGNIPSIPAVDVVTEGGFSPLPKNGNVPAVDVTKGGFT